MLLAQKQSTIQLQDVERVTKLITINCSTVLICRTKSYILYDIGSNAQISRTAPQEWENEQGKIIHGSATIMETVFHPKLYKIFTIVARNQKQKHHNWLFIEINLQNNKLAHPKIVTDFEKAQTKYGQMELKPRLILLPKSQQIILLREFYNDSMVIVYRNKAEISSFYVNQENMSGFNDNNLLISFRSLFIQKIIFELFDIHQANKSAKKNIYQCLTEKSGVIVSIKSVTKLKNQLSKPSSLYKSTQQNSNQIIQPFTAVLAVNWRNKSISYLIFQSASRQIIQHIADINTKLDTMFLSLVTVRQKRACSVQIKENNTVMVYENFATINQHKLSLEQQKYQVISQYQQCQQYSLGKQDFIILNYSQPALKQNEINCKFYRSVNREEGFIKLANQIGVSDNLLEIMYEMITKE